MMRLRRLSSLIRKEEAEEKRQAEEAEKSGGESQDSDSLMSSPFGSEPRTPLTPRLEPLVEEEAEQPEERALPSKDINHNEVVENSLSEKEGSIKHSEENEKITVNNLENAELPNGPRMSASSENDIEVDIPVDHVYGGIEICLCNACLHDRELNVNASETNVVGLHVTKEKCMPCFCCDLRACHCNVSRKVKGPFVEKSLACVHHLENSYETLRERYMMSKFEGLERGNYAQGWTLQALADPSKCLEDPVTSMVMHYYEINDPGLQGPPSSEREGINISNDAFKMEDIDCSIAEDSTDEISKSLSEDRTKVNEKSENWGSDDNQNHKPGHDNMPLRSCHGSNGELILGQSSEEGRDEYLSGASGLVKEEGSGKGPTDELHEIQKECTPNGEVEHTSVDELSGMERVNHLPEGGREKHFSATPNLVQGEGSEKGLKGERSESLEKCTSNGDNKPSSVDEPLGMGSTASDNGRGREMDSSLGASELDQEDGRGVDAIGNLEKESPSELQSYQQETNNHSEVQNNERDAKSTDLVRKRSQRKGGVVQAPKLQGIIEKSLEGDDVYLEDGDIFKQKASFESPDDLPTKEEKDTRRMSNFSILSEDSIDIPDLEPEETFSGRSDILAFDHNRLEAKAAHRGGFDYPGCGVPKIMPTKMANLAHMMLKIHQDNKMKKEQATEDSTSEVEKTLSVPRTLEGPPSPIKKRTNQGPIFLGHPKTLFGEETDPQLKFSIFDKYFLLLFTSKALRFNLCMLFGLILGIIINLSI